MPTFAGRPSTMSSLIPVEFPQNLWLDSKDSKYRNCNSANSPITNHLGLEHTMQKSSDYLFGFSIRSNVMGQRSGDG